ncbi:MAG: 4Fe-4S binding protein [Chitinispirillia bacterium]|nr:4Fe-4S binding protein [Chitinispirillia bacterium]MCL2269109.1 4Fe-4S binding protein [Chitinispirillia bacterium]
MKKCYSIRSINFTLLSVLILMTVMTGDASASPDRFPRPEFQGGYEIPDNDFGTARAVFLYYTDVIALFIALCAAAYLVLKRRSRKGVLALMLLSIAYFGFYKRGCVCSLGAIQNISAGIFSDYAIPITIFLIFILPLLFALFFGRVYCAAVCPMGAVQDLVAVRAKKVPSRADAVLRIIPHIYLGTAILFAATGAGFPICKLDPFAGIFRLGAPAGMAATGAAVIITGIFAARPYCRYLCPYGVLLGWMSLISKYRVKISPNTCVNCRLCENACPVDAIRLPSTEPVNEQRGRSVKRLKMYFALIPLLVAALAACGWFLSDTVSPLHPHVKLLRNIELEESGAAAKSLESEALRVDAEVIAELKRLAGTAKGNFRWGLMLLGVYLGIVTGVYLIRQSIYGKRECYDTDPMMCVGCGRCYGYCPKHKAGKGNSEISESGPANQSSQSS